MDFKQKSGATEEGRTPDRNPARRKMEDLAGGTCMRVGLISDIHGNDWALERVLAALQRESPDQIICLGDVAVGGPWPKQALDRIRALNGPVIMGNADTWALNANCARKDPSKPNAQIDQWCAEQLNQDDLAYIRTFHARLRVDLGGGRSLFCFHGTPASNTEALKVNGTLAEYREILSANPADVYAFGHIHVPMVRPVERSLLVNPGSAGRTKHMIDGQSVRPAWGEYAILTVNQEIRVELRRLPLDREAMLAAARKTDMPHVEFWCKRWV